MLKKIWKKLLGKSQSQKNADEIPTSSEHSSLIEHEQITGTPFTLVRNENNWCIVLGNYRITENYKTRNEALKCLEKDFWLIIVHLVTICMDVKNKNIPIQKEETNFK